MSDANPIDLLFGGMEKLGPGSDDDTLKVLTMLPGGSRELIVDAGCGAGRQTLALAKGCGGRRTPWIPMSRSSPSSPGAQPLHGGSP